MLTKRALCWQVESFVDPYDDIDAQAAAFIMSDAVAGADLQSVDPETRARLQALLEAAGALPHCYSAISQLLTSSSLPLARIN